jgi:hypothetical protein
MKKILIAATVTTLALNGCANTNLSREAQAGLGALAGAALGAGIGGAIGGGKGAAIGAGAGALLGGVATYALASDPYTQSVNQQGAAWQQETGAKPEIIKASQVVENGKTVQRIESQKMVVADEQMVYKKRLSPKVKKQLITAKQESLKVGGNVHVICPASATQKVMKEINMTGVTYSQDNTLYKGYVVVLSRSNDGYQL